MSEFGSLTKLVLQPRNVIRMSSYWGKVYNAVKHGVSIIHNGFTLKYEVFDYDVCKSVTKKVLFPYYKK